MAKVARDLKMQSINQNIQEFIKPLTDLDVYQLAMYLGGRFTEDTPNEIQTRFVDDFFGLKEWAIFVDNEKKPAEQQNMWYRPPFNLDDVRLPLMFQVLQRIPKMLLDRSNLEVEKSKLEMKQLQRDVEVLTLKADLQQAFNESFFDGVFDKCDGWCNISDVLEAHELLKVGED